jgi:hypothetical protein|tara:strand:+ start:760 stop:1017 length:258 start_codon:yes stop_codon:yes gene_type:complete
MDSIKDAKPAALKEPITESELLLNQVAEEKEEKGKIVTKGKIIDALEDINMNPGILLEATDYHAAWGYESDDDDDLVLFGVGGPA